MRVPGKTWSRSATVVVLLTLVAVLAAVFSASGPAGAAVGHNAVGHLDQVQFQPKYGPDRTTLVGWAADPDLGRTAGLQVVIYADGALRAITATGQARPDVAAVYPQYGANTGFSVVVPLAPTGNHTVCAYAINRGPGANTLIGCSVANQYGTHTQIAGHIDRITVTNTSPQKVVFTGWVLDPYDFAHVPLREIAIYQLRDADDLLTRMGADPTVPTVDVIYIGVGVRYDVENAYPGRGLHSGFSATFTQPAASRPFASGQSTCLAIIDFSPFVNDIFNAPVCTTFP